MFLSFRIIAVALVAFAAGGHCPWKVAAQAAPPAEDRQAEARANLWIAILDLNTVRTELGLTEAQRERLQSIGSEIRKRSRQEWGRLERLRFPPDARRAALFNLAQSVRLTMVEETLDPLQLRRLRQLTIQFHGIQSLNDPQVQDALGLSVEQKQQISRIRAELLRSPRESRRASTATRGIECGAAAVGDMEWDSALLGVVTGFQREKLDEMAGPPFVHGFPISLRHQLGSVAIPP